MDVDVYLERIGVPRPPAADAATLRELHRAHQLAVPFENLSVHLGERISLAEEHLHDHLPGYPVMPSALEIEGFAQLGGLLIGERMGYTANMILAKVPKAVFHFYARPGDTLTYRAELETINDEGALTVGTAHVGDRLQAEVEIFFANVLEGPRARRLFTPR